MQQRESALDRRAALALAAGGAIALLAPFALAQQTRHAMHVRRDAGCGCCLAWVEVMRRSGRFTVTVTDEADMNAVKQSLGVPLDLASCHTATVAGFTIEGHVPVEDVLRLIETRPAGVRGIAVPGMPIGSPGMEQAGMGRDAFAVIAFSGDGARQVFARYSARG
jgi:hypothetical protein